MGKSTNKKREEISFIHRQDDDELPYIPFADFQRKWNEELKPRNPINVGIIPAQPLEAVNNALQEQNQWIGNVGEVIERHSQPFRRAPIPRGCLNSVMSGNYDE